MKLKKSSIIAWGLPLVMVGSMLICREEISQFMKWENKQKLETTIGQTITEPAEPPLKEIKVPDNSHLADALKDVDFKEQFYATGCDCQDSIEQPYLQGPKFGVIQHLKQDFGSDVCNFNAAMTLARLGSPSNALIEGPGKYIQDIHFKEALMRYVGQTRFNPGVLEKYCLTQPNEVKQIGIDILQEMNQKDRVTKVKIYMEQ